MGTAIALLIGNGFIMNIYYFKKVSIDIPYFWKEIIKIFPAFILPITLGYLYIKYINIYSFPYFILGVGIYSIVFILSMWFIGMNDYEKGLFIKPLKVIFHKLKGW